MSLPSNPSAARRGYTLSEVMVTTTVLGLVMVGVLSFFYFSSRTLFTGEQKLLINADVRDLTNEMVENARESNFFVLYKTFSIATATNGTVARRDANNNGTINAIDRCAAGEDGDFLVFIYYADPFFDSRFFDGNPANDPAISTVQVTRIVGYWRAPNRTNRGEYALYRFDTDTARTGAAATWTTPWGVTFPATLSGSASIEVLLPPPTSAWLTHASTSLIVNDTRGLSTGGFHFINFQNRSVLVRAKILHGNQAKRVTNTYNFTITPRG